MVLDKRKSKLICNTSIKKRPRGRPPKFPPCNCSKMDYIRKVDVLNLDGNIAENWRVFKQNFEIFSIAAEISKKSEAVRIAVFLNAVGPAAVEVFNSFNITEEKKQEYEEVVKAFSDFCSPKTNEVYESFVFHGRNQAIGEPFDQFLINLKKLSRTCGFGDLENRMLRDRIVCGVADKNLQKRLLEADKLDYKKAVEMARASEASTFQSTDIRKRFDAHTQPQSSLVDAVIYDKSSPPKLASQKSNQWRTHTINRNNTQIQSNSRLSDGVCKYCGMKHVYGQCTAYKRHCGNCGKLNHFAKVCTAKKNVNEMVDKNEDIQGNSLMIDTITAGESQLNLNFPIRAWFEDIRVNNTPIQFKLDTGSSVNTLPIKYLKDMNHVDRIQESNQKLEAYGGYSVASFGEVECDCICKDKKIKLRFSVVDDKNHTPLLGLKSCLKLNLIKRIDQICISSGFPATSNLFIQENFEIFNGLGCFEKNYKIEIMPNSNPVVRPPRRVAQSLLDPLKKHLDDQVNRQIIEKVNMQSDWVSNLVIVEKPNKKIRVCLDPQELNKVIKSENYLIPTLEDITSKLSNKTIFTVLDIKDGYYQIKLHKDSCTLFTFSSPFGCYRYKRLPFGIRTATEIFQKLNERNFGDIKGVCIYIDDILIAGADENEHDEILRKVISRAKQYNVKFNADKLQYRVDKVKYLGHIISADGIACDPDRMTAIHNLGHPTNKQDLQKLYGMINYVRNFVPNLSEISQPLREILKKDVLFHWTDNHTECLNKIKQCIMNAPTLKAFNFEKPITLQTDASKYGLGCCLMQEGKPIAFASRSLSKAEINYGQVDKEFLAIIFACEKFNYFIYGKQVTVLTDHKPLIGIMNKELHKVPSARLQRMKLRLFKYQLKLKYVPGKYLYIADYLSRYFEKKDQIGEIPDLSELVHSLNISHEKKEIYKIETDKDAVLNKLKAYLNDGWPSRKKEVAESCRFYWKFMNDLVIDDNLVFLNDRIIIPLSLRSEVLNLLHKSHLGIEKTKQRARSLVYWPGLDSDIEDKVGSCSTCQRNRNSNIRDTMISHEIPDRPFHKIGLDIFEYNKSDYLVIMDYYSKFLDITKLSNKTANQVIDKLKTSFCTHGIPREIIADNMPFGSHNFREFCKEYDIEITTTSPHYPQSNGLAERSVQTAKSILKKCSNDSEVWIALLEYRNTPIKNMNVCPAELLMSRKTRSIIPAKDNLYYPQAIPNMKTNIDKNNKNSKKQYNKTARCQDNFKQDEIVWYNNFKKGWELAKIINLSTTPRSYWIELRDGSIYRRNGRFLRHKKSQPQFSQ